jgi:hypothetical protein
MAVRCPGCARLVPPEAGICPRCGAALTVPLRLAWVARLFWACPACGAEALLTLHQPLFGGASMSCRVCNGAWVLGADGQQLTQIDPATKRPLTAQSVEYWLATLPAAFTWRQLLAPQLQLLPNEICYVRVDHTRLLTPRQSVQGQQPRGRVEILPGIFERIANDPLGPSPSALAVLARGPFFVTDRRAVFLGNRKHVEVPLPRLDGVEVDEGFLLIHRAARTDTFGFDIENAARVREAILAIKAGKRADPAEPASRVLAEAEAAAAGLTSSEQEDAPRER